VTKNIYIVGGGKGGVGKSFVAIALIDFLRGLSVQATLVESDTSNPDVWKVYKDVVPSELVDLDRAEGWMDLVNVCGGNGAAAVVVNTAAGNAEGVARHAAILDGAVKELGKKLVTFWVINRQRDSLELLKRHMDALPSSAVHVLRNGYFGEERRFELYNDSNIRRTVEDSGGKSLFFPDLADRVSDAIYCSRTPIEEAAKILPIGDRAELARWRAAAHKVFAEAVDA
jgi:hypothetical protein